MTHILTLIASETPVGITHLENIERFIEANGIGLNGKPAWVDGHQAATVPIQNCVTIEQMKSLRDLLSSDRIDVLCTPQHDRSKKLLLADMDSTIVTTETLDELAGKAGIKDKIAAITARAMNGELDFHAALRERVGLLKGLPVSALKETLAETELCKGAGELVMSLRARGATCILVSGGFTYFTAAIAEQCGFNNHHSNTLGNDGMTLDGTVGEPILDKDSKLAFLKHYTQELGINPAETLAIGDGANDLPMLTAAGLGIGYRPKPVVAETVLNVLNYADLDKLKYVLPA